MEKEAKAQIQEQLAALVGKLPNEDQIERRGTKLVIPEVMSPVAAHKALGEYIKTQEAEKSFSHRTNYRPYDGLIATKRVLRKLTGMTRSGTAVQTLFGKFVPPTLRIATGVDSWEEAPTGSFPVEVFEGTVSVGTWEDKEKGILFSIEVEAPAKYTNSVLGFFQMIDDELANNSIYRGQAITSEQTPNFLDLKGVNPNNVVYSEEVLTQLNANVWSLLEHTQAMRDNNLPLKRAALLEGPYGTGKTLAAYLTAQKAVENGWTFLFVRPGKDDLQEALSTAQLYQPSVVFFEDIDTLSSDGTDVSSLLDMFDGIQAKGTEIVAILTTNHADKIHKGLVRPGRLDAVIHIGELDTAGIERLIRATVDAKWLPKSLDMDAISSAMEGFMPAFVKEAIDRAIRYSIARNGEPGNLSSQDFVDSANGLRPQLDLMNGARDDLRQRTMEDILTDTVDNQLRGRIVTGEGIPPLVLQGVEPEAIKR